MGEPRLETEWLPQKGADGERASRDEDYDKRVQEPARGKVTPHKSHRAAAAARRKPQSAVST